MAYFPQRLESQLLGAAVCLLVCLFVIWHLVGFLRGRWLVSGRSSHRWKLGHCQQQGLSCLAVLVTHLFTAPGFLLGNCTELVVLRVFGVVLGHGALYFFIYFFNKCSGVFVEWLWTKHMGQGLVCLMCCLGRRVFQGWYSGERRSAPEDIPRVLLAALLEEQSGGSSVISLAFPLLPPPGSILFAVVETAKAIRGLALI